MHMRTYLISIIVALGASSLFAVAPVSAIGSEHSDYIEMYCQDMLELRRCGTFQPVAVKVQKQAKALLARFTTMQDTEEEIEDFLPRLEEQFMYSDNRVVKFAAAYYIVYLETYLWVDHTSGSDDDDDLFASLFDDLDVDFLDSRTSTKRPVQPVVIIRWTYDDTDSLSRGTYRERAVSVRDITRREWGSIEKVRSDQSDVTISKRTISKQRDLLQVMIEAEDEDGHPATENKWYRMVAVLEDSDDEEVIAMRYDRADDEWYFARAIDTERYDEIAFFLLCEDCGGDRFGYPGSFRNWDVADEVTYQLETEDRYDDDDDRYCYDHNDRRYRCDDDYEYERRNHRNDTRYCYDRYNNRYRCDDDDRYQYRYDQLDLQQLTATPSRPAGQFQVETTLTFVNESNRSLSINVRDFNFSLRAYKEGGSLNYSSMSSELRCGGSSLSFVTLKANQSCTLHTTFYGVSGRENEQLFVQVQYQGNGYYSNSIATQTVWPAYYQPQPPVQQPIQQPVQPLPLPCPNLATAVGAWQASTMPAYAHCYRQGYPWNFIPLPNPLDPDYGGPFEIYNN